MCRNHLLHQYFITGDIKMENEVWKIMKEHSNYEVSNLGKIKTAYGYIWDYL